MDDSFQLLRSFFCFQLLFGSASSHGRVYINLKTRDWTHPRCAIRASTLLDKAGDCRATRWRREHATPPPVEVFSVKPEPVAQWPSKKRSKLQEDCTTSGQSHARGSNTLSFLTLVWTRMFFASGHLSLSHKLHSSGIKSIACDIVMQWKRGTRC